jgi:hypothetical protein
MLTVYRTANMEVAVNLMAKHIRNVLVDATLWVRPSIMFRPDLIDTATVYFDRVPSQFVLWQNNGGVLIRKDRKHEYDTDAIFFSECPRSIQMLDKAARRTRFFAVVYQPPTWRTFFETLETRFAEKSEMKRFVTRANLERVQQFMEDCDTFNPRTLEKILLVRQGQIPRPSSAPLPLSGEARSGCMPRGVP